MTMLREVAGRLQAKVKQSTQAINRLHNLAGPRLSRTGQPHRRPHRLLGVASARQISHRPTDWPGPARHAAEDPLSRSRTGRATPPGRPAIGRLLCPATWPKRWSAIWSAQVRHTQRAEEQMRRLLSDAYAALPASPHLQVVTIPGIGVATAAALIAQTVDINRFATPEHFVGYFGVFPEENSSGVDKFGNPVAARHHAHVAQRQRPGALLSVECRPVGHRPQPGHRRPLSASQGQGQTRRRRPGPVHAQTAPSGLRRLENQSAL